MYYGIYMILQGTLYYHDAYPLWFFCQALHTQEDNHNNNYKDIL